MKKFRSILFWVGLAILAAIIIAWAFPRAYPLFPRDWQLSRKEAEAIALERLRDLGDLPPKAYVIGEVNTSRELEHRLLSHLDEIGEEKIRSSRLARAIMTWQITVYDPDSASSQWSNRARLTPQGEVIQLQLRVPSDEEGGVIDPDTARLEADRFLREQGIDLEDYEEPEIRTRQLRDRTDMTLRYRDREALLGRTMSYGLEVTFAGERLTGFTTFRDDPDRLAIQATFRPVFFLSFGWTYIAVLLLPLVAIPFVRRYHAGEIGVTRGLQIAAVVAASGLIVVLICARTSVAGMSFPVLTRPHVTLLGGVFLIFVLFFIPITLMAFLSWSVGESLCRERWGTRLAAFDALFKRDWANSTFAEASLRGRATPPLTN